MTVNSAKLSPGVQFKQPTPGHLYLVVNVSLKNTASDNQVASSLLMFSLRDSTGQTYNEVRTGPDSPDGTVLPSETSRGNVSYEVPANFHTFTFGFQPGALNTDRVEWTLTV